METQILRSAGSEDSILNVKVAGTLYFKYCSVSTGAKRRMWSSCFWCVPERVQSVLLPFWLVSSCREAHTLAESPLLRPYGRRPNVPGEYKWGGPWVGSRRLWVLIPGLLLLHWINAFTSQVPFLTYKVEWSFLKWKMSIWRDCILSEHSILFD